MIGERQTLYTEIRQLILIELNDGDVDGAAAIRVRSCRPHSGRRHQDRDDDAVRVCHVWGR